MIRVHPARKSNPQDRSPRVKAVFPVHTTGGAKGLTQDISATGIFMELDATGQKEGSIISFWVELNTVGGTMKLVCKAEIVRAEQLDGKTKVGAKILSQELQSLNK